jgi:hypothetical protein
MDPREDIERRIALGSTALERATRSAEWLSWARVGYFVAALLVLLAAGASPWPWLFVAAIPFIVLVQVHRAAADREDRARGALAAARGALARMDRDWGGMPPLHAIGFERAPNRAAIRDLDVHGERSLFRLVDVSQPAIGGATLLRWLLSDPDPLPVIHARQESVEALRQRTDYLLESARVCRHGSRPAPGARKLEAFRAWCERPGPRLPAAMTWVGRALTLAFAVVVALMIVRPAMIQPLASTLLLLVAAQFTIAALARRHLRQSLGDAADLLPELAGVTDVMRAAITEPPVGGRFGAIQRTLVGDDAVPALSRLSRLFEWNAVHHSPMLHAAVNAAVAFDAHLATAIDAWHAEAAKRVPPWVDLVGEAEALTALATLAHENPGWIMPRVHDDEAPFVSATACGHPLIEGGIRVTNPVSLEAPGSAIVISGSNMSGKTTYLRAIGLNALLAMAGGPACAAELTIRRSRVRTTVRVEDDLGAGVSLFLAEVSRLRDVVADAGAPHEVPVLFLLDEILHGTNAEDRRQATRLVLARLLAAGASGIITTHDPRIAQTTEVPVAQAHFTDAVTSNDGQVTMTFDYTLRPGPATTTNALRILEALGLD